MVAKKKYKRNKLQKGDLVHIQGMIYENEPAVILAKSHVNNEWFVHTISGKQIWHVGVNLKLIAKGKN